jgi:predicted HicB family RNase H-like nuclease
MTSPRQSIHIRLPRSLYEAVRTKADAEDISLNSWLLAVIAASHPEWVPTIDEERNDCER